MEFRVLGPLEVEGAPSLGGRNQRLLLALLLLARAEPVGEARLVDALWGEDPPETARHALQVYVSALRKAIRGSGAQIRRRGTGYELELGEAGTDADRFRLAAAEAGAALDRGDAAMARERLRDALALWRGEPLADLEGEPALDAAVSGLSELRLRAQEDLAEAELALGLHEELVPRLEAAAREYPYRERVHRQLMLALYRSGRQSDALDAFRRARAQLVDELGLEPSAELRELEAAILRQDPSLDATRGSAALPAPLTALVGRDAEAAEVAGLLEAGARLVTLTGPGGIGKTRLAIEVAQQAAGSYRDGAAFVSLAELDRAELVPGAVAAVLEVDAGGASLVERLRPLELLLVVDNLEHLLDGAALLPELLRSAPRLAVVATSRVPLELYGEHEYRVPPLTSDSAVELFRARARAAGRVATPEDDRAMREICERLDRLPLAIELAAARTREYSPAELLPLLAQRLELASRGPRDVEPRQRSLRTALDWSLHLLDENTSDAFARLGVFAGGWTPAAAAELGIGSRVLEELERQSLVVVDRGRSGMLETIREYALERLDSLGDADAVRRRHVDVVLRLVREAAAGREFHVLGAELPNLRAALAWALAHDGALALELAIAPGLFWRVQGHFAEGERWLTEALATGAGDDAARAEALLIAATLVFRQGRYDDAERLWGESLELWRGTDDDVGLGRVLGELGVAAAMRGDYPAARERFTESVGVLRAAGYPRLHVGLANLGTVAADMGDDEEAVVRFREAIGAARGAGDDESLASALQNLGRAEVRLGRRADGISALLDGLSLSQRIGYLDNAAFCLAGLAVAEAPLEPARAVRLASACEALLEKIGAGRQPGIVVSLETAYEHASDALGADRVEALRLEGGALSLEEAASLAAEARVPG